MLFSLVCVQQLWIKAEAKDAPEIHKVAETEESCIKLKTSNMAC